MKRFSVMAALLSCSGCGVLPELNVTGAGGLVLLIYLLIAALPAASAARVGHSMLGSKSPASGAASGAFSAAFFAMMVGSAAACVIILGHMATDGRGGGSGGPMVIIALAMFLTFMALGCLFVSFVTAVCAYLGAILGAWAGPRLCGILAGFGGALGFLGTAILMGLRIR